MRRLASIFIFMIPTAAVVIYISVFMAAGIRSKKKVIEEQNIDIRPAEQKHFFDSK